jgi:tetratricopeptide (TPR) repeat protein
MGFFSNLFGKETANSTTPSVSVPAAKGDQANDPNMIKVFDEYGREMFMTKQQWRDNVLLGNLEEHRDNPDELYGMLIGALGDGFAADVVCYAEHLRLIDPIPSRGAAILGIVYMEVNRLDDAQRVFDEYIAQHGEEGVVLTNLAKVYSRRGDDLRAESILWHALELDPNQDNGLGWYVAIQREREGEAAELDALRQVAALPHSWRARLWLAQNALQHNNLTYAETLYQEALTLAEHPLPQDLLIQMSGDLGNSGHLAEIIRHAGPYFDPAYHGLQVGNNLIKANLELGRSEEARSVLQQLYDQKRPDWKPTLHYWDTELAKADTAKRAVTPATELSVSLLSIVGPLWMRDGSPFTTLLPAKRSDSKRIAIFGSTALREKASEKPELQLSDSIGRLSRSVPLILAELIQLTSDAVGLALIPWAQGQGFALFGHPYDDADLCEISSKGEDVPDYIISVIIDATLPAWKINLRLVRRVDGERLAETSVETNADNPGSVIERLPEALIRLLTMDAGVSMILPPNWYQLPIGHHGSDYLLRIEQLLCITCKNLDFLEGGGLYGEREILDGILQLCVNQPQNPPIRMLFAQMMRQMKKVRPEILSEYKDKTAHLQRDYPIKKEIDLLVEEAINEVFAL